jgi:SpoVK/Ycf46/Vps4 family AAA+-type ATPase
MLDLPDSQTRFELIKALLEKNGVSTVSANEMRCVDFPFRDLLSPFLRMMADRTNGYSNADLVHCLREASMIPVRDLKSRSRIAAMRPEHLRAISFSDLEIALETVKPSANEEHTNAMKTFAARCGTIA